MNTLSKQINKAPAIQNMARRRKLIVSFIALVIALTIYPNKVHAQVMGTLEVNIPFEFHAGETTLPPGNYSIHVVENSDLQFMQITSADGSASAVFEIRETDASSAPAKNELIFNKYGDHYFLAKVFDEGNPSGNQVVESNYEKTVSKAAVAAQIHVSTHRRQQG